MEKLNISPTKSNLLSTKSSLELAEEGYELLDKKRNVLIQDVYWVGVNDKETDIFESLWPLPEGIAYNS